MALQELLRRAAAGCLLAWHALQRHYHPRLRSVLRHHYLRPQHPLNRVIDPDDLIQPAWLALHLSFQQPRPFASEGHLWGFLVIVVVHQFFGCHRAYFGTAKRSPRREEPLDLAMHDRRARVQGLDPALEAEAWDEYEHLLAGATPHQRDLLQADWPGGRPGVQAQRRALRVRLEERLFGRMRTARDRRRRPAPTPC
jgi:hypothetical protein